MGFRICRTWSEQLFENAKSLGPPLIKCRSRHVFQVFGGEAVSFAALPMQLAALEVAARSWFSLLHMFKRTFIHRLFMHRLVRLVVFVTVS